MNAKHLKACAVLFLASLTLLSLCVDKQEASNSEMNKEDCEKSGCRYFVYTVMKNPPGSGSVSSGHCDCGPANLTSVCGNGRCETNETSNNCPQDSKITGCILQDTSCCRGSDCTATDISCSNSFHPRMDGCDANCQPIVKCEEPCVPEGGSIFDDATPCCAGLTAIRGTYHVDGTCLKDLGMICAKCGDGVCSGPENDCNCPQDCKTKPVCAKDGEIFSDESRRCCAGLQMDFSIKPCSDGKIPCYVYPMQFSCKKPSNLTCAQECQFKGYLEGYCGGNAGCKEKDSQIQEYDINQFGCMNSFESNDNISTQTNEGEWSACCCSGVDAETCVKDGGSIALADLDSLCCSGLDKIQTIRGHVCKKPSNKDCADNDELVYNEKSAFGAVGGPHKCCDPSAGIKHVLFSDGGAAAGWCIKNWNKTCGNSKCETNEDKFSCPQDCK